MGTICTHDGKSSFWLELFNIFKLWLMTIGYKVFFFTYDTRCRLPRSFWSPGHTMSSLSWALHGYFSSFLPKDLQQMTSSIFSQHLYKQTWCTNCTMFIILKNYFLLKKRQTHERRRRIFGKCTIRYTKVRNLFHLR